MMRAIDAFLLKRWLPWAALGVFALSAVWVIATNKELTGRVYRALSFHGLKVEFYQGLVGRDADGTISLIRDEDYHRLGEDEYMSEYDRIAALPNACTFLYQSLRGDGGLWACTRDTRTRKLYMHGLDGTFDGIELRRACIEHLIATGEAPDAADLLPTDRVRVVRILWMGWIVNGLTILSLLTLAMTISLRARHSFVSRRSHRRLEAGLCPDCTYPLPTSEPIRCPECGWGAEAGNER